MTSFKSQQISVIIRHFRDFMLHTCRYGSVIVSDIVHLNITLSINSLIQRQATDCITNKLQIICIFT